MFSRRNRPLRETDNLIPRPEDWLSDRPPRTPIRGDGKPVRLAEPLLESLIDTVQEGSQGQTDKTAQPYKTVREHQLPV